MTPAESLARDEMTWEEMRARASLMAGGVIIVSSALMNHAARHGWNVDGVRLAEPVRDPQEVPDLWRRFKHAKGRRHA